MFRRDVKTHEMPTGAGSSGAYAYPPVPTLVGTAKVTAATGGAVKNRHARKLANPAIVEKIAVTCNAHLDVVTAYV